jgi:hypothetical protein
MHNVLDTLSLASLFVCLFVLMSSYRVINWLYMVNRGRGADALMRSISCRVWQWLISDRSGDKCRCALGSAQATKQNNRFNHIDWPCNTLIHSHTCARTHIHTHTQIGRQTHKNRQTHTHTYIHTLSHLTDRQTHTKTDRHTLTHTHILTHIHTHTNTQIDRHTKKQTERHTHTNTHARAHARTHTQASPPPHTNIHLPHTHTHTGVNSITVNVRWSRLSTLFSSLWHDERAKNDKSMLVNSRFFFFLQKFSSCAVVWE